MSDQITGQRDNPVIPGSASWLDPGLVLCLTQSTYRDVSLTGGVITQILDSDPERAAFVLIRGTALVAFPRVGPFPDVDSFGVPADAQVGTRSFILQDWLSLVCQDWYALAIADGVLRVVEFRTAIRR